MLPGQCSRTASGEKAFRPIQLGGEPEGKELELAHAAREPIGVPCLVTSVACQQHSHVGIRDEQAEGAQVRSRANLGCPDEIEERAGAAGTSVERTEELEQLRLILGASRSDTRDMWAHVRGGGARRAIGVPARSMLSASSPLQPA